MYNKIVIKCLYYNREYCYNIFYFHSSLETKEETEETLTLQQMIAIGMRVKQIVLHVV